MDHFGYFKGKIVPGVSLGCTVVLGGHLKGKIGSLPFKIKTYLRSTDQLYQLHDLARVFKVLCPDSRRKEENAPISASGQMN